MHGHQNIKVNYWAILRLRTARAYQRGVRHFVDIIIIIIIMFIDCKWVDTRWQWSFNMLHMHGLWRLII